MMFMSVLSTSLELPSKDAYVIDTTFVMPVKDGFVLPDAIITSPIVGSE